MSMVLAAVHALDVALHWIRVTTVAVTDTFTRLTRRVPTTSRRASPRGRMKIGGTRTVYRARRRVPKLSKAPLMRDVTLRTVVAERARWWHLLRCINTTRLRKRCAATGGRA